MKSFFSVLTLFFLAACGANQQDASSLSSTDPYIPKNLYDALSSREVADRGLSFNTLKKAIEIADLATTLQSDNDFSIFAPTDEAFAKIPEDALRALLSNKALLVETLTRHVTKETNFSTYRLLMDTKAGRRRPIQMLTGDRFDITSRVISQTPRTTEKELLIGNAKFLDQLLKASNGNIVAIDTVL